jgi:Mg-chelatase subunit ChlD
MQLPSSVSGVFEYMVQVIADNDISEHNNSLTFSQEIVGKTKILLITGASQDKYAIESMYGEAAEITSYLVTRAGSTAPFMLEEIIEYDEIVLSNVDVRNIKNVNAFIDALDMAISQYGKSLITFGDLRLQTDASDPVFKKLQELLPVEYGNDSREGRLYTIVLDVSHSMFMASKFTIAKQAAINLLSILSDDDYVGLVTFSGEISMKTPKKAKEYRQELIEYIETLSTQHGTDIGLGLEEALKMVQALRLEENQVMVISDGFSFESEREAKDVAKELYDAGATVSAITTYIPSDGNGGARTMRDIVNAGVIGNYYEISRPEDVVKVVFGTIADNFSEVIIEKDAQITIAKHKDDIVKDITSFPVVSGYVLSLEKYDAIVPLTITYQKNNGYQETVPFYAYRNHGNGRIASITSSLTGAWTNKWSSEIKEVFVQNLFVSNTPKERVDYPFSINIDKNENTAYLEILPSILNPEAKTVIEITLPNGKVTKRTLAFDSKKYVYTFTTGKVGTYRIKINYSYEDQSYNAEASFEIPYLSEYNAFATFDKFKVYEFMRGNGEVLVDEIPSMEYEKDKITTYKVSYVIPLLIAAVSIFVVDVFIRKLRVKKKAHKKSK